MKAFSIAAAAAMLLAAGTLATTARAEGPRASSENNWPGMTRAATAAAPSAALEGPRASSGTNWPGMASAPVAEQQAAVPQVAPAPHYVWQEGYDHGGKWRGRWVLAE